MIYLKSLIRYAKLSAIFLSGILIISFFLGLLNLIGLSYKITSAINIIIMVAMFLSFGIIEGLNADKKGFVAGFKIGFVFLLIILLINLILFQNSFKLSAVIYYVILLFSSVFGAMIGINRKKKE